MQSTVSKRAASSMTTARPPIRCRRQCMPSGPMLVPFTADDSTRQIRSGKVASPSKRLVPASTKSSAAMEISTTWPGK